MKRYLLILGTDRRDSQYELRGGQALWECGSSNRPATRNTMKPCSMGRALCLFLVTCLSGSLAYGQEGRAAINGTITDTAGALVAGAQVSIRNTLTGQVTTVTTTTDGNYSAPFLQAGKYDVSVSHEGVQSETQTGLTLTASAQAIVFPLD